MIVRQLAPDVSVGFRDMVAGDRAFIVSSWLRGFHKAGDWPRRLGTPRCPHDPMPCGCCRFTHRRFFDEHGLVVEDLVTRAQVLVACNPARDYQILGYIVFEPGMLQVLHWVFVKKAYRWDADAEHHPRIGTALLHQAFPSKAHGSVVDLPCSHWTKAARHLAPKWRLVYDPFLLEDIDARA